VFLQIDGTLIVQLVNFVVFIVLLDIVFLKPVGAAIAKRRAYIDGLKRDVEAAEMEIKTAHGTAEGRRAAARREAEAEITKARTAAQSEALALLSDYQSRASAIVEQAHEDVQREIAAVRASEPQVVESITQSMLDRAIGPGATA
jgi:F-type H+-transporting ATPase subunit b